LRESMTNQSFQLEVAPVEAVPDANVIRISGKIGYPEAPELRSRLLNIMAEAGTRRLVLELSEVERMDTSGVAVLVEALRAGTRNGLRVVLCHPSDSVIRMFQLAGIQDALGACCRTVEEVHTMLME
jgi:anti-sigma B factor antagonist